MFVICEYNILQSSYRTLNNVVYTGFISIEYEFKS